MPVNKIIILMIVLLLISILFFFILSPGKQSQLIVEQRTVHCENIKELYYQIESVIGNKNGRENEIFSQPHLTLGNNGDIYISDLGNNRILRFDKNGKFIKRVGKAGQSANDFLYPYWITTGNDNNIYILETLNKRVKCYDENLKLLQLIYPSEFFGSNFVANSKGQIYLKTNEKEKLLSVFNNNGEKLTSISKPNEVINYESMKKHYQFDFALDNNDNLHVAYLFPDSCIIDNYYEGANKISRNRLVIPELTIKVQAKLLNISLICGKDLYLYLLLIPSNIIYKFDSSGNIKGKIILSVPRQEGICYPFSFDVDKDGNIYIADNSSVMFFKYFKDKTS
ncbi:MAG: 6-bladed beta-propeller [Ignavibacteriales bacterium]|nr:6-bladed beta-propeller [Ignavibacteriales bacterium]